jgi:Protein of unknown function (DUF3761)
MGQTKAVGWAKGHARATAACVAVWAMCALCGCGSASHGSSNAQGGASGASTEPVAGRVALHLNAGSYSLPVARTTISGRVTRGASVRVNGRPVHVAAGRWHRTLVLHLGRNRVAVEAAMHGRAPGRASIRVTRTRSAAELEARAAAIALRAEAGRRKAAEAEERKAAAARERKAAEGTPVCTNGTYVNSAGNTVCSPEQSSTAPAGATAECEDGTYSFSESRSGTCSSHGGVANWL